MRLASWRCNMFMFVLALTFSHLSFASKVCEAQLAVNRHAQTTRYLESNARNFDKLSWAQLNTVIRVTSPFIDRLSAHDRFLPIYAKLKAETDFFLRYPAISKNPEKIDICFMSKGKKLVDYEAYRHLRGIPVCDVFPEAVGDTRLFDEGPAESSQGLLYVPIDLIGVPAGLNYDYYAHEFAHFLHFNFMFPDEVEAIDRLYKKAILEGRTLDDYAASNSAEYFAQGFEAYFASDQKPSTDDVDFDHTPSKLRSLDPALFSFIENLTRGSR
jgi:hypothetical protein